MNWLATLALSLMLALLISLVAWWRGALSPSGVVGAVLIGTLTFGLGGPTWGAVLVAFFAGSTLVSFYHQSAKAHINAIADKGSRRDLKQTLANGGLGALLAVLVGIVSHASSWYPILTLAYFGSLSAAAADTWATELGVLAVQPPRLITTGTPVPAGTSGGITALGLLASLAGGLFIGASAFALIQLASLLTTGAWFWQDWFLLPVCTVAGLSGSLTDSLFGAAWQHLRYCDRCNSTTERYIHTCGATTRPWRGPTWLDNDAVNFLSTLAGALTAVALGLYFV